MDSSIDGCTLAMGSEFQVLVDSMGYASVEATVTCAPVVLRLEGSYNEVYEAIAFFASGCFFQSTFGTICGPGIVQ